MHYYAHTPNQNGDWHSLEEHLRAVGKLAKAFATAFEAGELGYYVGLWHDLGKFSPQFQQYLIDCAAKDREPDPSKKALLKPKKVDHKAAGTLLTKQNKLSHLPIIIQGHHGGLHTPSNCNSWLQNKLDDAKDKAILEQVLGTARQLLPDLLPAQQLSFPGFAGKDAWTFEFFMRMLFSALVDADFLDTEQHFQMDAAVKRGISVSMNDLWQLFEADQLKLQAVAPTHHPKAQILYQTRQAIYQACLNQAEIPPGFFRLTVPTGGGKTRSGIGFAIKHALKWGFERIIIAVPFTTITEQTASIYRAIFEPTDQAPKVVLEHHSAFFDPEEDEEGNFQQGKIWSRLAAENWDAPIIVTTTVQLLESMFANSTKQCRKLHNLAKSVIIIDEAQALPPRLLTPIVDGLTQLCTNYRASVVISTATQPAFEVIPEFKSLKSVEIVPDYTQYFEALKRVEYEWRLDQKLTWEEVAAIMLEEPSGQALVVVNTKKDARALLRAIGANNNPLYFSTDLCGAHRQEILTRIKQRLNDKKPCLLVSTQAVEAGVDLDFPIVLRALGPLDSIIQAAGRCNREGKLDVGRVIVFEPLQGDLPASTAYKASTAITNVLVKTGKGDLNDLSVLKVHSKNLLQTLNTDEKDIKGLRKAFNYPDVAKNFHLIEDNTQSVVVLYGKESQKQEIEGIIKELRHGTPRARRLIRRLQPFVVAVHNHLIGKYQKMGLIYREEVVKGLYQWIGDYDDTFGIQTEGDFEPSHLVI